MLARQQAVRAVVPLVIFVPVFRNLLSTFAVQQLMLAFIFMVLKQKNVFFTTKAIQ